jgi:putative DNA primase/helicase
VIASESNKNQSLNPAKIKQLTGGNRVQAAFKHRDMFSYKPGYKIWLVSNHPVNGDVDDDALWGRVHIINFPHSHLHCEDMGLKERLKSPEVLRGVLYWAIQGAIKWYQAGRLPVPEQIKQSVAEHRAQLDTVQMWLDDKAELVEGEWTPNATVVSSYTAWCGENNYEPKRGKALTASLKHKGCVPGEKQYWNSVQTRGVLGLRIL